MRPPATHPDAPFRALGRALLVRRARALGVRLTLVSALLAVFVGAFTFWQVRVPLDGAHRHGGPRAATAMLAGVLGGCLALAVTLAASRQVALAADPPGPEWLSLPVAPRAVERHLAREARLPALAAFVPALAAWLAGPGLVPWAWLLLLAFAFTLLFVLLTRAACAVALRMGVAASGPARALPAAWRALVSARQVRRAARVAPARFAALPRWRALARLDRTVSLRAGSPRARLALATLFLGLGLAAWYSGGHPLEARARAFAGTMVAVAGLGAWAAWRAAGDPPSAVRALPLALGDAWRARAWPLLGMLAVVLVLHACLAPGAPLLARAGLALSWLLPSALVLLLGLHLGLSLPGAPAAAENLFFGWLGVGIIASLAIPLFGWGVLVGGFVFATRRVPRWYTPEVG